MSEDKLQAKLFQWVWNSQIIPRGCMWAVPNGGKRDKITANTLKATGVVSGVWDLHVFYKGKFFIIETKTEAGRLSASQKEWKKTMIEHGAAKCYVYRNLEEGKEIIYDILKQTGHD